jgi:hypothetical protein
LWFWWTWDDFGFATPSALKTGFDAAKYKLTSVDPDFVTIA